MTDEHRHMTDQLEFASDLQDALNKRGVELARKALYTTDPNFDGKHCVDCGDDIDPKRLELLPQCARCTGCQGRKEKRR